MELTTAIFPMSQDSFNYESDDFHPEEEFTPDWLAHIFFDKKDLRGKKRSLLAILRKYGLPLRKKELARALYPKAFDNKYRDPDIRYFNGYEWCSSWMASEKEHIRKTGAIIRSIDNDTRKFLSQLERREEKLEFLRHKELIIRVGETESGETLYAYHGPDCPQPLEILENYVSWAEIHHTKQSQLLMLAQNIRDAATIQASLLDGQMLDPDDLPNEDGEINKWDSLEETY